MSFLRKKDDTKELIIEIGRDALERRVRELEQEILRKIAELQTLCIIKNNKTNFNSKNLKIIHHELEELRSKLVMDIQKPLNMRGKKVEQEICQRFNEIRETEGEFLKEIAIQEFSINEELKLYDVEQKKQKIGKLNQREKNLEKQKLRLKALTEAYLGTFLLLLLLISFNTTIKSSSHGFNIIMFISISAIDILLLFFASFLLINLVLVLFMRRFTNIKNRIIFILILTFIFVVLMMIVFFNWFFPIQDALLPSITKLVENILNRDPVSLFFIIITAIATIDGLLNMNTRWQRVIHTLRHGSKRA